MKYNLTFYKDADGYIYFIINSNTDLNYCSEYILQYSIEYLTETINSELLDIQYDSDYEMTEEILYHVSNEDELVSLYLDITLDEVFNIIQLYMDN